MVAFVRVGRRAAWTFIGWAGVLGAAAAQAPAAPLAGQPPTVYRCPGPPVLYTDSLSAAEARSRNCKPLTDLPVAVAPPAAAVAQPKPPLAATPAAAPSGASPEAPSPSPTPTALVTVPAAPPAVATVNALPAGSQPVPRGGTRLPVPPAGPTPAAAAPATPGAVPTPTQPAAVATAVATVPLVTPADSRVRPDDQRSRDAEARRILEAELRREEARLSEALRTSNSGLRPGERLGADAAQIRRAESDIEAIRRELGRLR